MEDDDGDDEDDDEDDGLPDVEDEFGDDGERAEEGGAAHEDDVGVEHGAAVVASAGHRHAPGDARAVRVTLQRPNTGSLRALHLKLLAPGSLFAKFNNKESASK